MARTKSLVQKAQMWEPKTNDHIGRDRKRFLEFMLKNCRGANNALSTKKILQEAGFENEYRTNSFQHQILIPFKREDGIFIGSSRKGLFFVESARDAEIAEQFYVNRIRREFRHLRGLRRLIAKNKLYDKTYSREKATPRKIFLDESGTPDIKNSANDPFFIVSGIVINNKKIEKKINTQLEHIRKILGRPRGSELKGSSFSKKQYEIVLNQLSLLDFEFATICFQKSLLTGKGFQYPTVFYKYAFNFLLVDLLSYTGTTNIVFDEYGGKESKFKTEFFQYLRRKSEAFPVGTINQLEMLESHLEPLIQVADIICGAVRNKVKKGSDLLDILAEKAIKIDYFPPLS